MTELGLELEVAEAAVGATCTLRSPNGEVVSAAVTQVERLPPWPGSNRPGFSILWEAGKPPALPQGTYPVQFPDGAEYSIFVVPIQVAGGRLAYQAIFS